MDFDYRRVDPVSSPAAYIGGKKQLAGRLVELIERVQHVTYAEPFVGMGGVFLKRRLVPKVEVMNDLSGDVANLFRILQRHYVPLMDMLRFQLTGRREFERLTAVDPSTLTDLERANRFLYLQRTAYGGKVAGRNFGVSPGMPGRFDVSKLEPMLADLNERLSGVIIENLPFDRFIERYDGEGVLFYLDPPYWGSEDDYGRGLFAPESFERLASILGGIAGSFVLSLNDAPPVREIFAAFVMETVDLTYTIGDGVKAVQELIISSPNLPLRPLPQASLFGA
ncbi:DNA adenine methylase [Bosea minatitlanensis]|uniref:site-specific DNA-methyltransferase (adenine-specific) n=1 Tax=Bosea minatitlanensis TaxID=128782 RepID=A0ABW0EYX4_9HYPH|nr:DNA adenine methylase [Bosea minatitlanensis]MCT4491693.1 DNA adenine methylase [Bosea minatitlanensis]